MKKNIENHKTLENKLWVHQTTQSSKAFHLKKTRCSMQGLHVQHKNTNDVLGPRQNVDFMGVFHWSCPCNQLYDSRVSCKNQGRKSTKKHSKMLSLFYLPDRRRIHLNPRPAPALQLAPQPQPAPRRRRKPPNPRVMPFIYLGFYITFNTVQVISRW